MKKYSIFLTTLLIIFGIAFLALVGYTVYYYYDNYTADQDAEDIVAEFENYFEENIVDEGNTEEIPETENNEQSSTGSTTSNNTSSYSIGTYYNGYKVVGIISIPKLNIKYPIFEVDNSTTLRIGVAAIYPASVEYAINNPGNVVIAGHNYRSSRMFSKISTLATGDSIYITSTDGKTLEYKVYNNYTADANDFNYATRDTGENTEISLSTCTSNASTRTIIWAKVD